MTDQTRISVVVITFNRADLLFETLRSIKSQTVSVDEIVVVDDGGSDDTEERLKEFDSEIVYVWQPNAGMQAARNLGVRTSRFEWIAFSDDDDLWKNDRCELIKSLIHEKPIDVVACDFSMFCDEETIVPSFFERHQQRYPALWDCFSRVDSTCFAVAENVPPLNLLTECPFWGSQLVVRRSAIEAIAGWDESVRGIPSEDMDFSYRIIRDRRLGLVMKPTLEYRSHRGNVSSDDTKKLLGRLKIASRLREKSLDPEEKNAISQYVREGLSTVFWSQVNDGDLAAATKTAQQLGIQRLGLRKIVKFLIAIPKYLILKNKPN